MTKRLKTTLLIIFTAVLLIATCLFALPSFSAFADQPVESPDVNLNDDNADGTGNRAFYFTPGCSIDNRFTVDDETTADVNEGEGFMYGDYGLTFQLNLNSLKHKNLLKFADYTDQHLIQDDKLSSGYYKYTFTAYRVVDDDHSYPLEEITVLIEYTGSVDSPRLQKIILRRPLSIKTESFDFLDGVIPLDYNEEFAPAQYAAGINAYPYYSKAKDQFTNDYVAARMKSYIDQGYDVLYWSEMSDGGLFALDGKPIEFVLNVDSPTEKYFVEFKYQYKIITRDKSWTGADYGTPSYAKGGCVSEPRSVHDVLSAADTQGELEGYILALFTNDEFASDLALTHADAILNNTEVRTVILEYLKQIEGTPFAEKVQTEIEIEVTGGTLIHQDDIAALLGSDVLECLNSYSKEPEYIPESNIFRLKYLDAVWLRAITEDGNYSDYFFDINKSFKETYDQFVDDGAIPAGLYEYLLNEMKVAYKDENGISLLAEYDADEIYGYFGFIVIPEVNTLDNAFVEMFGEGTKTNGVKGYFESETSTLSRGTYNKLLSEYGYSWLDKLWNNLFSSVTDDKTTKTATYHLFYCDAYDRTSAVLGKGGQDDATDGGAIADTGKGVMQDVGDFVGDVWNGIVDGANNLKDTLLLPFQSTTSIIITAVLAVVVVIVLKKLGIKLPKKKSSSGGKKKKKK